METISYLEVSKNGCIDEVIFVPELLNLQLEINNKPQIEKSCKNTDENNCDYKYENYNGKHCDYYYNGKHCDYYYNDDILSDSENENDNYDYYNDHSKEKKIKFKIFRKYKKNQDDRYIKMLSKKQNYNMFKKVKS